MKTDVIELFYIIQRLRLTTNIKPKDLEALEDILDKLLLKELNK
tara:strand:+ start:256 stop:387 length:132 start_codon:yes stop_codon:yes gene_type:complete